MRTEDDDGTDDGTDGQRTTDDDVTDDGTDGRTDRGRPTTTTTFPDKQSKISPDSHFYASKAIVLARLQPHKSNL